MILIVSGTLLVVIKIIDPETPGELHQWLTESGMRFRFVRCLDGYVYSVNMTDEDILALRLKFNL